MTRHPAPCPTSTASLRAAYVLLALLALAPPVLAQGTTTLALRVADLPVVPFDSTALGRATHTLRLLLVNQGTQEAALEPLSVRFRPIRDGVVFPCDEPKTSDGRWPATLEPGGTFEFSREVTCDTPLPGRYDVEVRVRPRAAAVAAERIYGSVVLQIDPGANPPVRIPWEPSLYGAASGTNDMRPTNDPAAARVVVALINATRGPVTLAPIHATIRTRRRGFSVQSCREREVDLAFSGSLLPGRSQALSTSLGCDLSTEAIYDVDVSVVNPRTARLHLATLAVRVRVNAPPAPGPEDEHGSPLRGGT